MMRRPPLPQRVTILILSLCAAGLLLAASTATAQHAFVISVAAEKKLKQLSAGPMFWQVENFSTLAEAMTAAGPTSFAAEVADKVWLFTLGPMGSSVRGGRKIVEVGPVHHPFTAPEYLLRINYVSGPPGATTRVHTYPGSVAFYVLAGRLDQRTPHGVKHVWAGQSMDPRGADMPMEVSSSGTTDLKALLIFVVDATKPFLSPAQFE